MIVATIYYLFKTMVNFAKFLHLKQIKVVPYFQSLDLKKNTTCKAVHLFFSNKQYIFQQTTQGYNYTGFSLIHP